MRVCLAALLQQRKYLIHNSGIDQFVEVVSAIQLRLRFSGQLTQAFLDGKNVTAHPLLLVISQPSHMLTGVDEYRRAQVAEAVEQILQLNRDDISGDGVVILHQITAKLWNVTVLLLLRDGVVSTQSGQRK